MTRSGSFPDRVRVADADDRDFRSCAGEQRQEDPHGAFLCSGCAAHVRVRRGCFVWCRARVSPGPGCTDSSVRAVPEEAQRPKNLAQPLLAGFISLCVATRRRASLGRGRVGTAPVDRWTQRPPCKSKASGCSPIVPGRGGPRGSRRARERPSLPPARRPRHGSQRRPLLESKAHSLLPLPELDAGAARPKAAPRPQWRSSTSGAGSRRTSTC